MKNRIPSLCEFIAEYNNSMQGLFQTDSYTFEADKSDSHAHKEWESLLKIVQDPKHKNDLIDVSYSEWILTFEKDTDLSYIPKDLLKKLKKHEK